VAIQFQIRNTCPICGGNKVESLCDLAYTDARLNAFMETFYHGRVDKTLIKTGNYRVVQCVQCDFIYQPEILNDAGMSALYGDWVDQAQSLNKKQNAKAALYRQYAGQIQTLQRLFPGPPGETRVLEYGMGWGYWSRMAQAHGFDVSGYELSRQRIQHARNMGLNVIGELPQAGQVYHFIFANQVFEHLPDPRQTLETLGDRLTADGVVCIRVPDGRAVADYLKQHGWSPDLDAIHPLEHINCFTRRSLIRLAAEARLKPFNPPLRLNWGSLWGGLKREIADRFFTTHLYFRHQ